ncbi:hypothetical protein FIBSPDRAFT_926943 [Athelia psychrophila]|uniref:CBM1 domain-containing protein n=1 Tax=Athelia psychrophila TaxID=1759441 RepID=A0A166SGU6_9AGAM|nr:hypothetical protein FIBSPDRAFT_926943 [Fibularhizoctonia sp. CBS 109695]
MLISKPALFALSVCTYASYTAASVIRLPRDTSSATSDLAARWNNNDACWPSWVPWGLSRTPGESCGTGFFEWKCCNFEVCTDKVCVRSFQND